LKAQAVLVHSSGQQLTRMMKILISVSDICSCDLKSLCSQDLEVVHRKSDVRKKGYTRGWELMLSYDFRTGLVAGFCKGTSSSYIVESIKLLKACGPEVRHPLLLSMVLFGHDSSFESDIKQRGVREWLRRLEHAIAMRPELEEKEGYMKYGVVDLGAMNRDLVECHAQVLWQRPISYLRIIDSFKEALELFYNNLPEKRKIPEIKETQTSMLSRLEFYRKKWQGIDTYAATTIERLEIQKSSVRSHPFLCIVRI
jgi:hypothetical protein